MVPGSGLRRALALTLVVLLVELAGGLYSHSLALLSDAGHVLTDVFALGLAWFAFEQAQRPADRRRSYGYHRATILAALVNSAALIVIVIAIAYEAMRRLAANSKTIAEPSGAVAVAAFLFHRDQLPKTTLNVAVISGGNIEPKMLEEIQRQATATA